MNTGDMITELKKHADIFEIFQKTTFEGRRNTKNRDIQNIEVSIFDAGSQGNTQERYHCVAISEDGKKVTGNNASTVSEALFLVHWEQLDK